MKDGMRNRLQEDSNRLRFGGFFNIRGPMAIFLSSVRWEWRGIQGGGGNFLCKSVVAR